MPFGTLVEDHPRVNALFLLALRNVIRHRRRTLLTLAATMFGVIAIVLSGGFVEDTVVEAGESMIHSNSGHLQVSLAGYSTMGSRHPERYWIEKPEGLRTGLSRNPGVSDVMLRIRFSGLIGNGRTDWTIQGEGIDPEREQKLGTYVTLSAGRQLGKQDEFGVLIGHGVATALKLKPGDPVNITVVAAGGATNVLEFEVVGVFQTYSKDYDARTIRIPLIAAQSLLTTNGAHTAVIVLEDTQLTDAALQAIEQRLPPGKYEIRTWVQLNDFYVQTVELYNYLFGFLLLIILIMLFLSASNMVNMNAFERVSEFGTMLAMGNTQRHVFRLILTESFILGLVGSLLGVAGGAALAHAISSVGIPMPPPPNADLGYVARILVVPRVLLCALVMGVLASLLAALHPARSVSRTEIPEALRRGI